MTYKVIWRRPALSQMSAHVAANPEWRLRFAAALRVITDKLSARPMTEGESRFGAYRVMVAEPLTVYFRPAPAEGRVYVTEVHLPR